MKVVFSLIAILALAVLVYLVKVYNTPEIPRDVLPADSYPEGTTISIYEKAPTGFPRSLILENEPLDYSGVVKLPNGKSQTTVSYVSRKAVPDLRDLYIKTLPAFGWKVSQKSVSENLSLIKAGKGEESLVISIAPIVAEDVLVTFQYESK